MRTDRAHCVACARRVGVAARRCVCQSTGCPRASVPRCVSRSVRNFDRFRSCTLCKGATWLQSGCEPSVRTVCGVFMQKTRPKTLQHGPRYLGGHEKKLSENPMCQRPGPGEAGSHPTLITLTADRAADTSSQRRRCLEKGGFTSVLPLQAWYLISETLPLSKSMAARLVPSVSPRHAAS